MRILIADDERASRRALQQMLQPFGACDLAEDGKEAGQLFAAALDQKKRYNLVLLDLTMPEMDGHETLGHIRALEAARHIPEQEQVVVLIVTSSDVHTDIERAFITGCQSYLLKPISQELLERKLRECKLI